MFVIRGAVWLSVLVLFVSGACAQDMKGRPFLGVLMGDAQQAEGALVTYVIEESPADIAGILPRDIIVAIDDSPTKDSAAVRSILGTRKIGDTTVIRLLRGTEEKTAQASLVASTPLLESRALVQIGMGHFNAERYAQALPLAERALELARQSQNHDQIMAATYMLGRCYTAVQRFDEAEPLIKAFLAHVEKVFGPKSTTRAIVLNALADIYQNTGRKPDALAAYQIALQITEEVLGPEHVQVALLLHNIAVLSNQQIGEKLEYRALAILEKTQPPPKYMLVAVLLELGQISFDNENYTKAQEFYLRAAELQKEAYGDASRNYAVTLNRLGQLQGKLRKNGEARASFERALGILVGQFGEKHPDVAATLNHLGALHQEEKNFAEAEKYFLRSLAIWELGSPYAEGLISILHQLSDVHFQQKNWPTGFGYLERATVAAVAQYKRDAQSHPNPFVFALYARIAHRLAEAEPNRDAALMSSAFELTQFTNFSSAAASAAQAAERRMSGNVEFSALVRRKQDLHVEWMALHRRLMGETTQTASKQDLAVIKQLREQIDQNLRTYGEIAATFARKFPQHASLSVDNPLSIANVQALLSDDEVLVTPLVTIPWIDMPAEVIIWAISKSQARWVRSTLSKTTIAEKVRALRCGVDVSAWGQDGDRTCQGDLPDGQLPAFNVGLAHDMYKELLAPMEGLFENKHLIIVPRGALARLPFNALVTRLSDAERATPDYRSVSWLGSRQPLTVLPSVQALRGIRHGTRTAGKRRQFLGIANPLFSGDPKSANDVRARRTAHLIRSCRSLPASNAVLRRSASLGRKLDLASPAADPVANLALLHGLSPLPETAKEVCAVAKGLGAAQRDVWLGTNATERRIKSASESGELARYGIIHFATHGLLPGSAGALREAAIALTPPSDVRAEQLAVDDGLLTASEIATLRLNADWVILSACNTAGTRDSDDPLGGLASAFLYAGGTTLLVSHWEVYSDAAVDLITRTFAELARSTKSGRPVGRSEAMRRSMAAMIARGGSWSHPAVWAPFMLLGEGGRRSKL